MQPKRYYFNQVIEFCFGRNEECFFLLLYFINPEICIIKGPSAKEHNSERIANLVLGYYDFEDSKSSPQSVSSKIKHFVVFSFLDKTVTYAIVAF